MYKTHNKMRSAAVFIHAKKRTNTKCSSFYLSVITAGKPFFKLSRRQRLVKHKALNSVTANFSEIVKLLLSFNSLGDSFLAKLFNHFYNVIEHYKIFILALIILFKRNKGLVYLYYLQINVLYHIER